MEILGLRAGWVQGQELSSHCMPSCIAAGCNYRTCLKSNGNTHPPKKKKKKGAAGDNDVYCTSWSLSTPSFPFWNTFCVWTLSMIGRVPYIVVLYNKHSLRDKWLADGPLLSEQIIPWFLLSIYFFYFFYQRTTRLERKENRHGFVPRHLSKTPLMRENMWELWKIMQIRIRWCSRGLAVSFHPFYLKSGSRGVH